MKANGRLAALRVVAVTGMLAVLPGGTGCAQFELKPSLVWLPRLDSGPQVPTTVTAIWTNAILQQPGAPATRGFGARLMFYGPKQDKPIRVDGTLTVYAFDELRHNPAERKPDRKYVFTREQFASHYSRSKLGDSYSIWIPWDKAGSPQQQVSLIVRFDPVDGPAIVGSQTKLTLPGESSPASDPPAALAQRDRPTPDEGEEPDPPEDPVRPEAHAGLQTVQHASHYAPLPPKRIGERSTSRKKRLATTTITLPPAGR